DYAREQTKSTINEARRALWDMRHDDDLDLVAAIRAMVEQAGRDHPSIAITLDAAQPLWAFSSSAHEVLMSVREALYNAIQHSGSDRVEVRVDQNRGGNISISVTDHGAGFDPERLPDGHYGLIGMRERMAKLHGQLTLRSMAGKGTTVTLSFHLESSRVHRNGE
ncbi:MAG TPA: ATP-binding protein, partial [Acidobacteriaceae bacterium]